MLKKVIFALLAVAICPTIMISVFAATQNPIQTQELQSVDQLVSYVNVVKNANEDLVENTTSERVPATITFAKYVSFGELEEYISAYDIEIKQMQLRGLMEDGTRVTVATLVHEGMDYTEAVVREQARAQEFELIGITDVYVYIRPAEIENISDNALTFLVDSSNIEEKAEETAGLTGTMGENNEAKSVFPKSLTWQMEDLNLLK